MKTLLWGAPTALVQHSTHECRLQQKHALVFSEQPWGQAGCELEDTTTARKE